MAVEFRPLEITDLSTIIPIEQQLFDFPYNFQQFEFELLHNRYSHFFKMVDNEKIIGWAGVVVLFEQAQLLTIAVDKPYQNEGYGEQLLRYCIKFCKAQGCEEMMLEVDSTNRWAIRLYEKLNFKQNRIRKHYYGNHDGIEMKKDLT